MYICIYVYTYICLLCQDNIYTYIYYVKRTIEENNSF